MSVFGDILYRFRHEQGQTQQQFITEISLYAQEFMALNTVTLSRWENGTTETSLYRKRLILKFFHTKGLLNFEPYRSLIRDRYKVLYLPLSKIFEHNYETLIHNLPKLRVNLDAYDKSSLLQSQDLAHLQHIIDIEVASHAALYYKNSPKRLQELTADEGSYSLIIEKSRQHLGHFIMYKITHDTSDKIIHYQLKEDDLALEHFCSPEEVGDYYIHALYAVNPLIASILNVDTYLHLFDHISAIKDIVIFSSRKDGVRLAKAYGIEVVESGEDLHYGISWHGMRSPVEDILFSDTVLKLVF